MLSFIYSAELKILCNPPGLSGCRGGRLARSENGAPLLIDIKNGSPIGLVEIADVIKGKFLGGGSPVGETLRTENAGARV